MRDLHSLQSLEERMKDTTSMQALLQDTSRTTSSATASSRLLTPLIALQITTGMS
jgi:hypothetical protein